MSLAIHASRVSPRRESHLALGELYAITGRGESVDLLPQQVFRLEALHQGAYGGTVLLVGTLWWRVFIAGRSFSGTQRNHAIATHQVSIGAGSRLSSRHDFHLERIDRADVKSYLGSGHAYSDYLQSSLSRQIG